MGLQEYLLVGAIALGAVVITSAVRGWVSRRWLLVFFAAQPVLLFWGWLGVMMLPLSFIEGIDGEWVAEGSPTIIAAGLWILSSLWLAWSSWRQALPRPPLPPRLAVTPPG
jgi:hypothetical protein